MSGQVWLHVHDWSAAEHPRAISGQFTHKGGGEHRKRHGVAAELTGKPEPGKPFLIYRLGQQGTRELADRNAGNAWGVAEHLTHIDDFGSAQPAGGTGDHINIYEVVIDTPVEHYQPIIGGRKSGPAEEKQIGYRERAATRTPPAISISFGQTGYKHRFISSFPLSEARALLKERTGYESFDDAGWGKGGEIISEAARRHLGTTHDAGFDPAEARDPKGEWTKGGAGGETFASPNIHELPSMTSKHAMLTAQAQLKTRRHRLFQAAAEDIDLTVGIASKSERSAIGAWRDGAEGTTVMVAPHATADQLRLSAAMKGWLGQQKAVLSFAANPQGKGLMYSGLARGSLDDIHRGLLSHGLENHTLVPTGTGAMIYIADTDASLAKDVAAYSRDHHTRFSATPGDAEFIGATNYEGTTDAEQRAEGRRAYEALISAAGDRLGAAEWRRLRDRWGKALEVTQDRAARRFVHVHVGDQEVFVEAEHPRKAKGPGGGEFTKKGTGGVSVSTPHEGRGFQVHVHQPQPAGKPALKGSHGHPATISSARVTAKKSATNSEATYTQTGLAAMRANPEKFRDAMQLLKSPQMYPYFRGLHGTPDEIAEQVIAQEVDNLKFFAANAPPHTKEWGTKWYGEENKAARAQAAKTGLPLASVAGAYAALSPQNDWNMNVYQGDVVIDAVLKQQKTPWSEKMGAVADQIGRSGLTRLMIDKVRGKRLEEITSPVEQAMWIRVWNEATSDRYHRLFRPDGQLGDWARKNDGGKQPATWKTLGAIANAIKSIKSGGDREIISEAMGGGNKVRSFYNNILDPESANGDITVDTHAVGAALFDALGGSTAPVLHGLGMTPEAAKHPAGWKAAPSPASTGVSGLYGLHAEAYRRAARDLGIRPLELQSLTWEAKRALFEHMPEKAKQTISGIWRDYHAGKGTLEEARNAVVKAAGGFKEPDWTRAPRDD